MEKGKYKGGENEGQKTGKERIRFAYHTISAVWAFDHCSLNKENKSTCCYGHTMSVKPISADRRMGMVSLAYRRTPGFDGSCDLVSLHQCLFEVWQHRYLPKNCVIKIIA